MITLLQTAERVTDLSAINNYVFQRHLFAYKLAIQQQWLGRQVVELGSGNGYGMRLLAPHTQMYTAIDKKVPHQYEDSEGTRFIQCRLPNLSMIADQSFDTVICFQVIEHIRKDGQLLAEIKRIVRPGGRLLLTTPNRLMSLTRNPFHIREYKPAEMTSLIRRYFPEARIEGVYGAPIVMEYYAENKASVERFTRFDVLNLQYLLPRFLLQFPYTLANNMNRLHLLRQTAGSSPHIVHSDFYLDQLTDTCLDYFVVAQQ